MSVLAGYCECGCGGETETFRYGARAGMPKRFIHGHNRRGKTEVGYKVDPETGCWIWQGACNEFGYGIKRIAMEYGGGVRAQRNVRAHRWYYEQHVGPIPDGLHLDHLCRNPPCCNPAHLEPVTPTENMRRGNSTKLTPAEVRIIRDTPGPHAPIAERFGISRVQVSSIKTRRCWKDID